MPKGKPRRTYGTKLSPKRQRELEQRYARYADERRRKAAQGTSKTTPQQGHDTPSSRCREGARAGESKANSDSAGRATKGPRRPRRGPGIGDTPGLR